MLLELGGPGPVRWEGPGVGGRRTPRNERWSDRGVTVAAIYRDTRVDKNLRIVRMLALPARERSRSAATVSKQCI